MPRTTALAVLALTVLLVTTSCSSSGGGSTATKDTTTTATATTTAGGAGTATTGAAGGTSTTADATVPTGSSPDLAAFCRGFRILNADGNAHGGLSAGLAKARAFYASAAVEAARLARIAPLDIRADARALAAALVTFRAMIVRARTAKEAERLATADGGPGERFVDRIVAITTWSDAHCPGGTGSTTTTAP